MESKTLEAVIANTTSPYLANDVIGTLLMFPNFFINPDRGVKIETVTMRDSTNLRGALKLLFFRDLPTALPADNAPCNLSAGNIQKVCGSLAISTGNYEDYTTTAIALKPNLGFLLDGVTRNLYVLTVAGAGLTYAAINALNLMIVADMR